MSFGWEVGISDFGNWYTVVDGNFVWTAVNYCTVLYTCVFECICFFVFTVIVIEGRAKHDNETYIIVRGSF